MKKLVENALKCEKDFYKTLRELYNIYSYILEREELTHSDLEPYKDDILKFLRTLFSIASEHAVENCAEYPEYPMDVMELTVNSGNLLKRLLPSRDEIREFISQEDISSYIYSWAFPSSVNIEKEKSWTFISLILGNLVTDRFEPFEKFITENDHSMDYSSALVHYSEEYE